MFCVASPPPILAGFPEPVAVFDDRNNIIYIAREYDCWPLRAHEWGHWLIWRLREFVDSLWELPWWGLRLRALVLRRKP